MAIIQDRLDRMEASKRQHAGIREKDKLKKMVEELQSLVKEQEAVIQMAMASRLAPTPAKPIESDEISARQRELEEKFRMVENERRQSMSLVDQLEKDKLLLEEEKAKFEEEKKQFRNALKMWAPGMGAGKFLAKAINPLAEKQQNVEGVEEADPIAMRFSDVQEVRAAGDATLKEVQRVFESEVEKGNGQLSGAKLSNALKADKLLVTLTKSGTTKAKWDKMHSNLLGYRGSRLSWEEVSDMYCS